MRGKGGDSFGGVVPLPWDLIQPQPEEDTAEAEAGQDDGCELRAPVGRGGNGETNGESNVEACTLPCVK